MKKTNTGLVDYARKAVGLPYWNGTFGQIASESLYRQKKAQLPSQYTASDFRLQYGKAVHDCSGLVKGYFWKDSFNSTPHYQVNGCPDWSVQDFYNHCTLKGAPSGMPEIKGLIMFKTDKTGAYHMGVYAGGGEVIEARGHAYGVIKSQANVWDRWGKLDILTYENTDAADKGTPENEKKPGVNERVLAWQKCAVSDGYGFRNYGCDGIWGAECEFVAKLALVREYPGGVYKNRRLTAYAQRLMGMPEAECDGCCGPKTAAKIKRTQQTLGLEPDGCIGPLPWKKLLTE